MSQLPAALTRAGYAAVLFEAEALGGGQTISSQGIIHSGAKYAIGGKKTKNQELLRRMPDLWRGCVDGHTPPDLSAARIASQEQYLAFPRGLGSFAVPFAARRLLADVFSPVRRGQQPPAFEALGFRGPLIRLSEPVFDIPSVVSALADAHADRVRRLALDPATWTWNEDRKVHRIAEGDVAVEARWLVATAGGGNGALAAGTHTQERPLHMVLLKGDLPEIWVHADVASGRPSLTISSHLTLSGERVWYLGGDIAENGVDLDTSALLAETRKRLHRYFPALALDGVRGATVRISRFESATRDRKIPDGPAVQDAGIPNMLFAWPTKLAYAPMLAEAVIERLDRPAGHVAPALPDAPPPVAAPPWETADWRALS
jgi:hypothetical protein